MKKYVKLMRVKHYIKNLLVLLPLFFGQHLFNYEKVLCGVLGMIGFCLISSAVYILNDLKDVEKDRRHETKRNRPIASGAVSIGAAKILWIVCTMVGFGVVILLEAWIGFLLLLLYFVLNIAYSCGLKNYPIVDIVILASGFIIRVFFGGAVTGVVISQWLYLVIMAGAFYMGLGKRRNELRREKDTREVLKYYNVPFLDKNMYICVALADVFYALWAMELSDSRMIWTVPIFIIILMRYSLDTEGESDGDPVEVILHDKTLIMLVLFYAMCVFALLYFL